MVNFTLKLDIEIFKLAIVTLALFVLYRYRRIFEASLSPSLLRKGAYVTVIFWLGFLADVMNDVYPTELTKILDDIIISLALVLGMYYLLDHMKRASVSVKPKKTLSGTPTLYRGAYLFCDSDLNRVLSLTAGKKVLAITRNPRPFKKANVPYLWLSRINSENTIDPLRLPAIMSYLISNSDENTVVIIDGIEYLVVENGFNSVLKFLTALKDNLLLRGATCVVLLSPETLDESQLALLRREFQELCIKSSKTKTVEH
ncbi:DUF835 domain-containing protein [Thermococcus sp. Bubb.Bath]|uniref:DUF835 domain-containing protein n=1 Tax=Thermococcus sp. Bubb.Bath TaxID=1638242 RepID=UPI00143A205D|nr:DUF835 domain-containing protein [Thermococcus sp. Bubb.Bath]NJF25622.1 DUF835 domain-containing protein [Thermococcus sp. Bubb.Bath]